jgi:hypothetical protein
MSVRYNSAMETSTIRRSFFHSILNLLGWTKSSSVLLGGFFLVCGLIAYIWWPLTREALAFINWKGPWWLYIDWLLLGIFAFMSLTIIARADLGRDALIVFVGMCGGLVIESWGTQTNLWHYFTAERPPLWIIPAWPIATLSIDRMTRSLDWGIIHFLKKHNNRQGYSGRILPEPLIFKTAYWIIFLGFFALMLYFTAPTFSKSFTILALILVGFLTLTPTDHRYAVITFLAGSGLGFFLEFWGTTRQCWTYYTFQTPPFFAVLAHGMAAVAFWRAGLILKSILSRIKSLVASKERNAGIS